MSEGFVNFDASGRRETGRIEKGLVVIEKFCFSHIKATLYISITTPTAPLITGVDNIYLSRLGLVKYYFYDTYITYIINKICIVTGIYILYFWWTPNDPCRPWFSMEPSLVIH